MNKTVKMLMAGVAIATLSTGVYARGGDCGYDGFGPMKSGKSQERMEQMREQRMTTLHDKLKLTAQQETAWKKFTASKPAPGKMMNRPSADEMSKLSAPQRLEKGLENMRAMEKSMSEHLVVLKEFHAALTPEQQKIFDGEMSGRGGHRGWK